MIDELYRAVHFEITLYGKTWHLMHKIYNCLKWQRWILMKVLMIIEFERLVVTRATENEMRNARTQNYGKRNRNCFHMCGPRIWTPSPRGSVGKPLKRGRVPPPVPKCQKLPVSFSHVDPVISVCLWREREIASKVAMMMIQQLHAGGASMPRWQWQGSLHRELRTQRACMVRRVRPPR
jgi:hypothetical protein